MSAEERSPFDARPSFERAGDREPSRAKRLPPAIVALSPGTLEPADASGEHARAISLPAGARALLTALAEAVRGGLGAFVLREPALGDAAFLSLAREARSALGSGWLAIHDRVHLADACGADAVHVGFRSLTPSAARAICAAHVAIGFSAHAHDADAASLDARAPGERSGAALEPRHADRVARAGDLERGDESLRARARLVTAVDGADFVFAGPVHPVAKEVELAPLGFDGLARLVERLARPTWAIGGLSSGDLARVRAAGARGAVVRRGILGASDPRAASAAFVEAWERAS